MTMTPRNLNPRERMMLVTVLAIVILFVGSLMLSAFRRSYAALGEEVATRKQELRTVKEVLGERELWEEREVWLGSRQPVLANRERAGVELLEEVRASARAHDITLERPEIATPSSGPSYEAVKVAVETRSDWPSMIAFLNELQQPERFVVFEEASLRIDSADPTKMRGTFRIAKWYAPGAAQ